MCLISETVFAGQAFVPGTRGQLPMSMKELGKLVLRQRGSMGVRAAAREIGISPATLSRIERGHIPDLGTLQKICDWLGRDVSEFVGSGGRQAADADIALQIAFKKKTAVSPDTAKSLANLILKASEQFASDVDVEGH